MAIDDPEKKASYNKIAVVFLAFSALCFVTSLFLSMGAGKSLKESLPAAGGTIGPIEVKEDYSVYLISVKQAIKSNGAWSFVSGDVLDANREYLFGFGKEFWKETGYDSDGRWNESVSDYDMKVTLPEKGTYYLRFNTDMSSPRAAGDIQVTVQPKHGSSLAHFILGIFGIIASIFVWAKANMTWGEFTND